MTSPPFTVDLLELAADVALVGAPRDDVASEILATHSLPDVFARLAAVPTGSKEESDLCVFLERMFATAPGATLLPSAMPYAEAGLAAASPRVRRLACAQLERAFAQLATEPSDTDDDSRSCVPDEIVRELIETIRDPDPGVAAAASSALAALATTVPETINPIVARLSDFVADRREPATRLRAHALAATLASASLRAAAAVAERGCEMSSCTKSKMRATRSPPWLPWNSSQSSLKPRLRILPPREPLPRRSSQSSRRR